MMYEPVKNLINELSYLPEPNVHGWLQECNKKVLDNFLSIETTTIIELGSWLGQSAIYMAEIAPNANIYCVDHLFASENSELALEYSKKYCPQIYKDMGENDDFYGLFLANVNKYADRIYAIPRFTLKGLLELREMNINPDLIYIDADHSFQAVKDDIEACKTLFPNAQIVGDDWNMASVKMAVRDIVDRDKIRNIENCWWEQK